jgi:biotin operon repressor
MSEASPQDRFLACLERAHRACATLVTEYLNTSADIVLRNPEYKPREFGKWLWDRCIRIGELTRAAEKEMEFSDVFECFACAMEAPCTAGGCEARCYHEVAFGLVSDFCDHLLECIASVEGWECDYSENGEFPEFYDRSGRRLGNREEMFTEDKAKLMSKGLARIGSEVQKLVTFEYVQQVGRLRGRMWKEYLRARALVLTGGFVVGEGQGLRPLTDAQLEVWESLKGRALTGKELAKPLRKSEANVRNLVMRINDAGYRIVNQRGRGYFRPDQPPPDAFVR